MVSRAVWDIYRYFYLSENLSSGDTNSKWYHTGLYHFQSLGNLPSAAGAARVERRRRSPRGEAEPRSGKMLSFKKGGFHVLHEKMRPRPISGGHSTFLKYLILSQTFSTKKFRSAARLRGPPRLRLHSPVKILVITFYPEPI